MIMLFSQTMGVFDWESCVEHHGQMEGRMDGRTALGSSINATRSHPSLVGDNNF